MATQLFFRNSPCDTHRGTNTAKRNGSASGWTPFALATTRGASTVFSQNVATVAGPTNGIEVTAPSPSGPMEWISPPVSADVTISGTITANIWAAENSMSANVAINIIVDILRAASFAGDGSNEIVNIVQSTNVTELGTSRTANNFTTGMTSGSYTAQTLNRGDRLRVRIVGDDAGASTMASTFTFHIGFAGSTAAADGDTYVTFSEDFSFESAPAGSVLYLTNTHSGLSWGSPVAPALISDFTGSDENPLSEGGNWAKLNSSGNDLKRVSNAITAAFGSGKAYWTPSNFGPDLEAYVTLVTSVLVYPAVGISFRIQGEGGANTWDGYEVRASGNGVSTDIQRITDAVGTTIGSGSASSNWASGDKLGVRCVGTTIEVYRMANGESEWRFICSATDATYASAGKVGLLAGSGSIVVDDFYCATDSNLFTKDVPTLISDFTGSDENPLSEGGKWANLNTSSNPLQRISGASGQTVAGICASYWTPENFGPDVEAYVTIVTLSTGFHSILLRIQNEGGAATWDGYRFNVSSSTTSHIYVVTNGVSTSLIQNLDTTWASGDKLGARIVGNTLQLWRQPSGSSTWNLVSSAVDSTYPSAGKIGLYQTGDGTSRLDDFYAATNSNLFTQKAWTSRGSGVINYRSDTNTGWVTPLLAAEWFTPPLNAFTLTGMAQANIRALTSSGTSRASMRCEIARVDNDGTNPTVWASWCLATTFPAAVTDSGELGTSEAARTFNVSGDDLAISDGQRLRLRLYVDDGATVAMVDAFTVQTFYNGTSGGASGDSYITLPTAVTEYIPFVPAPGPVWRRKPAHRFLTMR